MSTLLGRFPKDSFKELLKVSDSTGLTSSLQPITDGEGKQTPLSLSQTAVAINGLSFPTTGSGTGKVLAVASNGTAMEWITPVTSVAASALTGTTLASNVVTSSLTSVGTLSSLTVSGRTDVAAYTEKSTSITSTSSQNIDCSLGTMFQISMATSIANMTFTNVPVTGRAFSLSLFVTQSGSGSYLISWPGSVKWANATPPTLTTTVGKTDVISLVTFDAGTTWFGFIGGQNF